MKYVSLNLVSISKLIKYLNTHTHTHIYSLGKEGTHIHIHIALDEGMYV